MNAVGIDVSKDKSMVTVIEPLGVVAAEPLKSATPKVNSENWQGF